MVELLDRLASDIQVKLRTLGFSLPSLRVLRFLLETAYLASLKTEEGKFVRGSITYADPDLPDVDPPFRRRADYPSFTKMGLRSRLTVEMLVKLARAIDKWSGSIAVYGTITSNIFIWGILDQLVGQNVRLHREALTGFISPGIITITMDGVGELSIYHGDFYLGGLKGHELLARENDAFRSPFLISRILPALAPAASTIARALDIPLKVCSSLLFEALVEHHCSSLHWLAPS